MKEYFVQEKVNLKNYSTMGVTATAELLVFPYTIKGLLQVFSDYQQENKIMLGGGANIIFSQAYYGSEYVFVSTKMLEAIELRDEYLYAQCGTLLSKLAWFALEKAISGFTFLEDIPGTIGGAITTNAGTYNNNIADLVLEVEWFDAAHNVVRIIKHNCQKGAILPNKDGVVLGAKLKASPGDYKSILDEMLETKRRRYLNQPRQYPNAGSVFKHVLKDDQEIPAWKLIDEVGLKGYSIGNVMVSDQHSGFIIATGECLGSDVVKLVNECITRVNNKFGIKLELEWRLV